MVNFTLKQDFHEAELETVKKDNIEKIKVKRSSKYNIEIDIYCFIPEEIELPDNNIFEKVLPDLNELHCMSKDHPVSELYLRNILINSVTTQSLRKLIFHGIASIYEIYISLPATGEEKFSIYWILNKYDRMGYTRTIKIFHEEKTKIKYDGLFEDNYSNEKKKDIPVYLGWQAISLTYKKYNFIYSSCVPDNTHTDKQMTFIRFNEGDFPSEEEINDIINILSYLMGIELFLIGKTTFNIMKSPIRNEYYSIFRDDIDLILDRKGLPSVSITIDFRHIYDIEKFINTFIESYTVNKEKYPFEEVFWYIKESYKQNIVNTIQPLSTAYDLMCNSYIEKSDNGKLIEDEEFKSLLESIKDNFSHIPSSENKKILWNKITGLNCISGNHRNTLIFDLLEMELSDIEKQALIERNSVIHGSKKPINIEKRRKLSLVFYTLINRLILRLLDVQIPYIDYSNEKFTIQHPHKMQTGEKYETI